MWAPILKFTRRCEADCTLLLSGTSEDVSFENCREIQRPSGEIVVALMLRHGLVECYQLRDGLLTPVANDIGLSLVEVA